MIGAHGSLRPLVVALGGTTVLGSSTEQALTVALAAAESAGARTLLFGGPFLSRLPHFGLPAGADGAEAVAELVKAIRSADGLIIASPGYHGSISGLVKNALDHIEETARDTRPYLDGLPVGLIATAQGWQAGGSTLAALRSIVHALRGWPSPLGATINTSNRPFADGQCSDPAAAGQLRMVGEQVAQFALARIGVPV